MHSVLWLARAPCWPTPIYVTTGKQYSTFYNILKLNIHINTLSTIINMSSVYILTYLGPGLWW